MRCPARRWMPEGGVSAAYSLTRKLSSSRPLSSARIAVITLVVLAGGSGSVEFRSQTTSPVPASMMTAARAVMYGPAARPGTGAASAKPSANTTPAVLVSRILHPPPGSAILPTGDYSHVKARGSSKNDDRGMRRGAERCRRAQGRWGARGAEPVARDEQGRRRAHPPGLEAYASTRAPDRRRRGGHPPSPARGSPATRERPDAAQSRPAHGRCSLPPAPHVGPYGTRPPPCSNGRHHSRSRSPSPPSASAKRSPAA